MKKLQLLIFAFAGLLASCVNEPATPYAYNTDPKYTQGYVEFFGAEYKYKGYGVSNNLLSISLFTESLTVDSTKTLKGVGQFLLLEDVYIAPTDTILPLTTYTINDTHQPYTVSSGKKDTISGEPINAYISYYEQNTSKSTIKYITSGTFVVSRNGINFTISCNFKTADKKDLKGTFTGELPHFNEELIQTQQSKVKHTFWKL